MIPLWMPLWPAVELSNMFTILFVVICLFTMIAFIIRIKPRGMEGSCVVMDQKPMSPQQMMVVKNPFLITLMEENVDLNVACNSGVKLKLTGEKSFWLASYWGVNINAFHESLKLNWESMKKGILDGSFLNNSCVDKCDAEMITDAKPSKEVIVKTSKPIQTSEFGAPPRACYPLVVFVLRNEDDTEAELTNEDVVVMTLVVHVKDEVCQMQTSIISQYLKQKNGNILNLQSLYTPQMSSEASGEAAALCVVCQESPVSRALLPCRHTCVCGECYDKIDKCPLCRSYIHSFFKIREEGTSNTSLVHSTEEPPQRVSLLTALSSRVNSLLGFR